MTIKDLLQEDGLKDLKIINSQADLDRLVLTVESTETPDIIDYVSKNTLLLTTAMAFRDNQDEMVDLIVKLNALPCAGLAIKIGRFVDELDPKVIAIADELRFPLIQIPMYQTLGEVYHHVLAYIWNNENNNLIYALNVQKSFYNLILQGAHLGKLLNNLGIILRQPTFIFSLFGELCASSNTGKKEEKEMESFFQRHLEEICKMGETKNYWRYQKEEYSILVYSIQAASHNTHYLVVSEKDRKVISDISEFILEQIVLIFAIHFYKNFYRTYNNLQMRENFFYLMINKGQKEKISSHKILLEGKSYGLSINSYYQIVIGKLVEMEGKIFNSYRFMQKEEQYILIYEWLEHRLEELYHKKLIVFPNMSEWSYIFLLQGAQEYMKDEDLIQIHDSLKKVMGIEMIFAYGNGVSEVDKIESSYWKAKSSFSTGENQKDISKIYHYKPQNIFEILKSTSDEQIGDICVQILKSLAYPEDEMNLELRKTLKVYLESHCSVITTANRLYVHRNTIRYRIKKCQEILDNDLTDPDFCFQLQICLMFTEK